MEWLKKTWQLGRFKGVEIRLHISMLLIVSLVYVVSALDALIPFFIPVVPVVWIIGGDGAAVVLTCATAG